MSAPLGHTYRLKHGESSNRKQKGTVEYEAWHNMRARCCVVSYPGYKNYGGRGITIDPSWADYSQFLADMGRKPSAKYLLERKDNNLGYCKSNCVWASRTVQNRNRRCVKLTMQKATHIRLLYATRKYTYVELGNLFGVRAGLIEKVVNRRIWV